MLTLLREAFTKAFGSVMSQIIASALAAMVAGYFVLPRGWLAVLLVLTCVISLLAAFAILMNRKALKQDLRQLETQATRILVVYSKSGNDKRLVDALSHGKAHRNLQIDLYDVDATDQFTEHLEARLLGIDALCCLWNTRVNENHESFIRVIEAWLVKNKEKPFTIVADEQNTAWSSILGKLRRFKILDDDDIHEAVTILLSRSIKRTQLFVHFTRNWKLAFMLSLLMIVTLGIGGYGLYRWQRNTAEEQYFIAHRDHLRLLLMDGTLELSLWRTHPTDSTRLTRLVNLDDGSKELRVDGTVVGCALREQLVVGTIIEDKKVVRSMYWKPKSGSAVHTAHQACSYKDTDKGYKMILCGCMPAARSDQPRYFACLISKQDSLILTDSHKAPIAVSSVVDLATYAHLTREF